MRKERLYGLLCVRVSDIKERQRWSKRERACGMDIELVQNYLPVPLANRDMKKITDGNWGRGGKLSATPYPLDPYVSHAKREQAKERACVFGAGRGEEQFAGRQ